MAEIRPRHGGFEGGWGGIGIDWYGKNGCTGVREVFERLEFSNSVVIFNECEYFDRCNEKVRTSVYDDGRIMCLVYVFAFC